MDEQKKYILLATHLEPAFHGQAICAGQLLECSEGWVDIDLVGLNTVYADERGELKGFSFSKVIKLLKYILSTGRIIKKHDIDYVIVCPAFFKGPFLKDALYILVLRRIYRVRVMCWVHMDPRRINYEQQASWFQGVMNRVLGSVDCFVSCAASLNRYWPEWLKSQVECFDVANGVEDEGGRFLVEGGERGDICRVIYLSAIDDEKGWRELLAVALEIVDERDDFEFMFYGGVGAHLTESEVESEFNEASKKGRIKWLGAVYDEDKAKAFRDASIFVLPSYTEQFPLVVLEAMSYGLPVVATHVGAVRDVIPESELVEPRDEKGLKKAILGVWDNKSAYEVQSERNRAKYVSEFTKEKFGENWRELLIARLGHSMEDDR